MTYKYVINRTVRTFVQKYTGVRWYSTGGGGVTSYNQLTDKPTIPSIVGLATGTQLSDGLALKQPKKADTELYVSAEERAVWNANKLTINDIGAILIN